MTGARLMDEFPPPPERLVTLANWRKFPFTQWSFRNVRQLLPTAPIAASGNSVPLPADLRDIGSTVFETPRGERTTVDRALRETSTDALLVLRHGRLMTEWYANGMDAERLHIVFSTLR